MQLSLIDPRESPVATEEMLGDAGLRAAIRLVRDVAGHDEATAWWPYVERLPSIARRPAWLIDDDDRRYVVVGRNVFADSEFGILNHRIRAAALEAIAVLEAVTNKLG